MQFASSVVGLFRCCTCVVAYACNINDSNCRFVGFTKSTRNLNISLSLCWCNFASLLAHMAGESQYPSSNCVWVYSGNWQYVVACHCLERILVRGVVGSTKTNSHQNNFISFQTLLVHLSLPALFLNLWISNEVIWTTNSD